MRLTAALALTASFTLAHGLAAAPPAPPPVQVENIRPQVGGKIVYLPLAAPTLGADDAAQLSVDLYVKNVGPYALTVQSVKVEFPGSTEPSVVLSAGLQVRCPAGATDPLPSPVLPIGTSCRLSLLPDLKLPNPAPSQVTMKVYVVGNPIPLTIAKQMVPHVNSTLTGSYRFPAKSSDLPAGTFWSGQSTGAGSHHRVDPPVQMIHAYDLGLVRYDNGLDQWVAYKTPEDGEADPDDENDDYLVWDMPIYAMADGEVTGCEDGNADNDPGTPTNQQGDPNFVQVLHGSETAWYGHLRNGSIDPAVCADGVLVKEGQFLGRVGDSGASSKPHLHIQVRVGDTGLPLLFNDAFTIDRSQFANPPNGNAPWSGLNEKGLLWEKSAIWPSGLRRHDDIAGVDVKDVAIASSSAALKVTVARDANDDLRVDLWKLEPDANLVHKDDDDGGGIAASVGALAAAQPKSTNDLAAVVRTAAGNLKLIAYDVTATSTLVRVDERTEGPVMAVSATAAPFTKGIALAVRTQFGNLKVISYEIDVAKNRITRKSDAGSGAVKTVAVAGTQAFAGVVTASRGEDDALRLETFSITKSGLVTHVSQLAVGTLVKNVSIAWLGLRADGHDLLMTSAERLDGTLHVASWAVDAAGAITSLASATGGTAAEPTIARASAQHAITSMSDTDGRLKLIAWRVKTTGAIVRRAEAEGGDATKVSMTGVAPFSSGGPGFAAMALRDGDGGLKVIDWQVLLTD